ncbi:MAG: futalosine hydrolase [Sphingobacteriales bacterium]|jgi:futalosine hydrolase|nr:MAG: futalosine hydrolase [Sphingobacteriales bacterium]
MKITIVAATKMELQPLLDVYQAKEANFIGLYTNNDESLHFLVTGMGMMQTAAHLMWYANRYERDFYFDIGVAGAFNRTIQLCEVLKITSETYGDFGVENDDMFEDFFEMGFLEKSTSVFEYGLVKPIEHIISKNINLKHASSITVNKVHGNEKTITQIVQKYNADIENMEGLAFYYVMHLMQKPSIEIRSISNYVEKRNKGNWKLKDAIENLNTEMIEILNGIN